MKRLIVSSLAIALLAAGVTWQRANSQDDPSVDRVSEFMQAKLKHSQDLLEALTTEDYRRIAKQSQEISLLSQATTWQVLQTPEYREHSSDFRRTADRITEAAREKNLDGAALAYVEMTLRCVQCHKYVRKVRAARLNDIDAPLLR